MKNKSQTLLLSPLFIFGLFLLLLNDFYLKSAFSNFLTGKLSDFAGLFIFPLFWSAFFPKRKLLIYVSTAIFFVFWKSPFSQILIEYWNSFEILRIGRVVDYSDLIALLILPCSYLYFLRFQQPQSFPLQVQKIASIAVILLSVFAFTATHFKNERGFVYGKEYDLKLTKEEFNFRLSKLDSVKKFDFQHYNFNEPNEDSYTIELKQNYCDSNITVNLRVKEVGKLTFYNLVSLDFWCKEKPTEKDKEALLQIFEREVIEKLRQNSSQ
ncbi:MAG TPA: hypothetical protein PKY59_18355 [Pyrinomonadaceae bacterium]|nr:hypothetical protein [Pyrinomonadaceae bacterium]